MKKYWITALLILITISVAQSQYDSQTIKSFRRDLAEQKSNLYAKIKQCNSQQTKNQQDYDVKYYNLDLDLNPENKTITGTVEILSQVLAETLPRMEVNFLDNMTVTSVTMNNMAVSYSHDNDMIDISLDKVYNRDEIFEVRIEYNGNPAQTGFGAFGFNSFDGKPMIWSLSEPFGARNWWPCKDIPEDKADSVDINITVPQELIVASNGLLRDVVDLGEKKKYCWHEEYPIVTYLVSVAIYPYHVYSDWYKYSDTDSMEIQFYVFPSNYQYLRENYAKTKTMIKAFSEYFGQYPFIKEKYGHAEFLWGGAMEHQTISSMGGWSEMLIAHELAHQWWGDMITCESFHHIWLNEGFATYSEALWIEYLYGIDGYHTYIGYDEYLGPGTVYVEDPEHDNIFSGNLSYSKGAWVLHMLRHVVGDSAFFKILLNYREAYAYGTATTEDFQHICETEYQNDLDWFFRQWIYEPAYPQYQVSWTYWLDGDVFIVEGAITQLQTDAPIFTMPVDITMETVDGETTQVVWVDEVNEVFQLRLTDQPINLLFDRENWILKEVIDINEEEKILVSGFTVDDYDGGDDDGAPEPGETINLMLHLQNQFSEMEQVSGELSTDDPNLEILNRTVEFGIIAAKSSTDNENNPFVVKIQNESPSHWATLNLKLTDQHNFLSNINFKIFIGTGQVLLIDDDGQDNYETYYLTVLDSFNITVDYWDVRYRSLAKSSHLMDYCDDSRLVIWFTGNSESSTLTSEDQSNLSSFLDSGGNLFITGQDIGKDLVENGNGAQFYRDYLHAQLEQEKYEGPQGLIGVAGDEISDGLAIVISGSNGANNQTSPSVISPLNGAAAIFNYLGTNLAGALKFEGTYKLVYFAYGFEAITKTNPRTVYPGTVMSRILNWMGIEVEVTNVKFDDKLDIPTEFALEQNYPNPFSASSYNATTTISYQLPQLSEVKIAIYNLLGQRVKTLVKNRKNAGNYAVQWKGLTDDGTKVTNGIYIYVLQAGDIVKTRKLLLMR